MERDDDTPPQHDGIADDAVYKCAFDMPGKLPDETVDEYYERLSTPEGMMAMLDRERQLRRERNRNKLRHLIRSFDWDSPALWFLLALALFIIALVAMGAS